ncbi:MAG: LL-diaminopimelate aminotransferase [Gammaproteobacteria bacterium]|nr:MAG: LL-diaminopimelate aminotransferase [Gammaproteobacteria bacterium]
MDFFENLISERLGGKQFGKSTEIYKFEKIKRAKAEAKKMHPDLPLIDMGVGEPDIPADYGVVNRLSEEAGKAENRWYADNGIPEFQNAAAEYMKDVFGVTINSPLTQINHGIGSKPILAMLPLCLINPGDVVIATTPGYPVTSTYTSYLGGEVYNLPLLAENNFYPDLENIPEDILNRAKLLYLNYPNNPTGQVASKEFFEKVIAFAKENNIAVVHDAAYAALTFDDYEPLSILSIEGAFDVAVEVHSLSKAFNMTGWRLAFITGNEKLVKAFATVKDNTDSGQFRAIQKAGIYALQHTEITAANCERYSRRFDMLVSALNRVGFKAVKPKGTFYCYVPAPKGTKSGITFENAEQVSEYLIKQSLISTVPWDNAGAYIRFSMTFDANGQEDEQRMIDELEKRLTKLDLVF